MSDNLNTSVSSSTSSQTPNDQRRWWQSVLALVVAGGVVMGLALGARHVQGLFLLPITNGRGWTREFFALTMALQNLVWGITQPFVGMIADRFGAAKVIVSGLALYVVGLFLMANATTPLMFILSAGVCIGLALSGTGFAAINGALSRLVPLERRSWALGLAGAVSGLGQFLLVPLVQGEIVQRGWISALILLALLMFFAMPLARLLKEANTFKNNAQNETQSLSNAIREAFAHKGFWLLNLGFLACGFQLAFIANHLPAYLLDQGIRASDAVAALAIIALTNVAGIYYSGVLGARYRRKYLLAGIYLLRSLSMTLFILLPISSWSIYVFAAMMGFLWLGTVPLTTGLLTQIFGVRFITTLFGFVFLGHQIGSFFGVWFGGYIYEMAKSYALIWYSAIALGVIAAILHMPIDDREIQRHKP